MVNYPATVTVGETGHVEDHNAIRDAIAAIGSGSGLPSTTAIVPSASISPVSATVLHDCESLSNAFGTWSANNRYAFGTTLNTDATKFTTGTKSAHAVLYNNTTNNANMTARFWCDLAANVTLSSLDTMAIDLGFEENTSSLFWEVWDTLEFWIADGVGLTGNVVKSQIPSDNRVVGTTAPMGTFTFSFGGLALVRSFGFVVVKNTPVDPTTRIAIWADNVRIKGTSNVEVALANPAVGGAIVSSESGGLTGFPARLRTGKTMWDQRGVGGFWSQQFGRHIRELAPSIDETGSTDVTDAIQSALKQLKPGERLYADPNSTFRVDGQITVENQEGLTMDWQDSKFLTTVDHTDAGAMWIFGHGHDVTMRNFHLFGYTSAVANGSAMELSAGAPVVSGTTYTLPAQNDSVRVPHKPTGEMVFYSRQPDGTYRLDLTLSASVAAVNDCLITVVDDQGSEVYRQVLTLTTTPTVYTIKFTPSLLTTRIEWRVTKNTSTVSTISVASMTQYGRVGYDATKALFSGLQTSRGVDGLLVENFTSEGFGGDGITCSTRAHRLTWRKFMSRANRRQGISVNGDKDGVILTRIKDFLIICPARHGIDLEPETSGANVSDIRISDGQIHSSELGGFVAQGWSRISDMHVSDMYEYPGITNGDNFDAGAIGGTVSRYYVDSTALDDAGQNGQVNAHFVVRGIGMMVNDITCDRGFVFSAATSANDVATLTPMGNHADNIKVRRAGNHAVALCRSARSRITGVTTIGVEETFVPGKNAVTGLAFGPMELTPGSTFSNLDFSMHRNAYPDSFKGNAHSSLWVPLGMNVGAEPILGARGLSGRGAPITIRSSTTVTTTTSGSAVAVTPLSTLRLMLDITAVTGTTPLVVTVEASFDQTAWRPLASFNAHSVVSRETLDFYCGAEPFVRVTATVSGTASFTYSVAGQAFVTSNNLDGTQTVTTGATTAACQFAPHTTPANPSAFTVAQGGTTGGLTLLGTYYYRVAGRKRYGGPLVPLAEKSITLTGSNNSVLITPSLGGTSLVVPEGVTIYRGSAAGVYDTRYDWLPNAQLWSMRASQGLTDKGATLTWTQEAEITSGYPAYVGAQAGSFTPVDETGWESDINYKIQVTPSWATTVGVSAKRRDGFDLVFGTAAPAGATVDWFLVR